MPNRILKESICRSEDIDSLTWFEEVLFYRLIVICDDFGRFDGRIKIIKGSCFPLKSVTEKDIERALNKLSAVGLVKLYQVEEKPYLQLVTWSSHQTIRNQKSKYPECPSNLQEKEYLQEKEKDCMQLKSIENNCMQLQAIESKCSRNPIQSEYNPNLNTNICSEQNSSEQHEQAVITLLLNTGEEYPIVQSNVNEWAELYPAVDIIQELRNMKGWLITNQRKRKTKGGILRFVNSWLAKKQDKGGTGSSYAKTVQATPVKQNRFVNYEQRDWNFKELEKMERERIAQQADNRQQPKDERYAALLAKIEGGSSA